MSARFLARVGFDALIIDMEHSDTSLETATTMFGCIADAGCTAYVRVPTGTHTEIKQALDNGAYGVVVPMVNTPEQAQTAVAACRYPPMGTRSVGGSLHSLNFAMTMDDYFTKANDEVSCILQCEHIESVRNFDAIFSTPGIDAVLVGPADLAASMRSADGSPVSPEALQQAIDDVLAGCKRLKLPAIIHAFSPEQAKQRIAEGWQMIIINSDIRFLLDGAKQALAGLGRENVGLGVKY